MNTNRNLKLPARFAGLTAEEQRAAGGGSAVETAVKAVVAVGVSGALLCVAAVAAKGILGVFNPGSDSLIGNAIRAGQSFIDNALDAGRSLLDSLLPNR